MLSTFFPLKGLCDQLVWSPNGNYLAVASSKCQFFIYDIKRQMRLPWTLFADGTSPIEFWRRDPLVGCLAWSPNGNYLALSNDDDEILVLDPLNGEVLITASLVWHQEPLYGHVVQSISWSPDGKYLALTTDYKACLLYRVLSHGGHLQELQPIPWSVQAATDVHAAFLYGWLGTKQHRAVLSDEYTLSLATLNGMKESVQIVQQDPMMERRRVRIGATSCVVSPSGRQVALATSQPSQVHLYTVPPRSSAKSAKMLKVNIYQPEQRYRENHTDASWYDETPSRIAWSPEGHLMATSFGSLLSRIYIWDVRTGQTIQVFDASNADEVEVLAWGPNHLLAWGCANYFQIQQVA